MIIAVYCSAKDCIPEEYKLLGEQVGQWLAENGHTLVYGGATGGLMTIVSDAVKEHGGKVIGVVPQRIIAAGRLAANCDELHIVENMSERKHLMRLLADAFICLPGSYGTLDEMFDVIASGTVGEHHKQIYIFNHNNFYNGIVQQAAHMKELHFLPEQEHYAPVFVNTIEDLTLAIQP